MTLICGHPEDASHMVEVSPNKWDAVCRWCAEVEAARAEEREACIEDVRDHRCQGYSENCNCQGYIIAAIRARSAKP